MCKNNQKLSSSETFNWDQEETGMGTNTFFCHSVTSYEVSVDPDMHNVHPGVILNLYMLVQRAVGLCVVELK